MRKYKLVYSINEVNELASTGWVLHSVTSQAAYVMEYEEPAPVNKFPYRDVAFPTQFGDH